LLWAAAFGTFFIVFARTLTAPSLPRSAAPESYRPVGNPLEMPQGIK
jgi:hypothetical protein